jgi:hypothetical protein
MEAKDRSTTINLLSERDEHHCFEQDLNPCECGSN